MQTERPICLKTKDQNGYTHASAYRKNPKISDTQKFAVITLKVEQDDFSLE